MFYGRPSRSVGYNDGVLFDEQCEYRVVGVLGGCRTCSIPSCLTVHSPLRCAGCEPLDVIDCSVAHACTPGEQGYTCGKVSAKRFARSLAIQCRGRSECHALMTAECCCPKLEAFPSPRKFHAFRGAVPYWRLSCWRVSNDIVRSLFLRWKPLSQASHLPPANCTPVCGQAAVVKQLKLSEPASHFSPAQSDLVGGIAC